MILYMQEGLVDYVFFCAVLCVCCNSEIPWDGYPMKTRNAFSHIQGAWMSKIKTPAGLMFDKSCSPLPRPGTAEPGSHKGKTLRHSRLVTKSISTDCQGTNLAQRILPLPVETSTEQWSIQLGLTGSLLFLRPRIIIPKTVYVTSFALPFQCLAFLCLPGYTCGLHTTPQGTHIPEHHSSATFNGALLEELLSVSFVLGWHLTQWKSKNRQRGLQPFSKAMIHS